MIFKKKENPVIKFNIDDAQVKEESIKKLQVETSTAKLKYLITVLFLAFEIIALIGILAYPKMKQALGHKKNEVAVINVDKPITTKYIHDLMDETDRYLKQNRVKEFLVIMNSPGGSPTASEEFSAYLKHIAKKKPVTMYVDSIAASGAYYIASAIKPIYANKNAIIGSIGVILPHYSMEKLAEKVGVKDDYVAVGKFKKPISMLKDIDPESKKYLENNLLMPTYRNFLKDVADNRGIPVEKIEPYAQGKIFVANDPKIRGILVDKIAHLFEIKEKIKEKYPEKEFRFVQVSTQKKKGFFPFNVKLDLDIQSLTSSMKRGLSYD